MKTGKVTLWPSGEGFAQMYFFFIFQTILPTV